jgi:hypothetical protein
MANTYIYIIHIKISVKIMDVEVGEAECDPTHKSGVNILVKLNAGTVSKQL